jgi:hypothetical protein
LKDIICGGCGSGFNCIEPAKPGFIDESRIVDMTKWEISSVICNRCADYRKSHKITLDKYDYESYDYDRLVLDRILESDKNILVVLLIDLCNIPNSIYDGWSKLLNNGKKPVDIFIVGE